MAVFWVVAPCSLVEVYQRFRGPCCLHHQGDESHPTCYRLFCNCSSLPDVEQPISRARSSRLVGTTALYSDDPGFDSCPRDVTLPEVSGGIPRSVQQMMEYYFKIGHYRFLYIVSDLSSIQSLYRLSLYKLCIKTWLTT
jgi:hypothetical protein